MKSPYKDSQGELQYYIGELKVPWVPDRRKISLKLCHRHIVRTLMVTIFFQDVESSVFRWFPAVQR